MDSNEDQAYQGDCVPEGELELQAESKSQKEQAATKNPSQAHQVTTDKKGFMVNIVCCFKPQGKSLQIPNRQSRDHAWYKIHFPCAS